MSAITTDLGPVEQFERNLEACHGLIEWISSVLDGYLPEDEDNVEEITRLRECLATAAIQIGYLDRNSS